jgi:hypothetical protein
VVRKNFNDQPCLNQDHHDPWSGKTSRMDPV